MLKRTSKLNKTGSSLKSFSQLKNNKPLRATSNLSRGSGLKATSSLKASSTLKTKSPLKQTKSLSSKGGGLRCVSSSLNQSQGLKRGTSRLKVNSYKKTVKHSALDDILAMPKNRRIQNQAVIEACKRPYCEICGSPCGGEPHHIVPRGAGGPDIPENLIQLCGICHTHAHTGELSKARILAALSARLKISADEIVARVKKARQKGV